MADPVTRRKAIIAGVAALAVPFEGLRQIAYYDPPGILTVCYGHTGADVQRGRTYTHAECKALLEQDTSGAVQAVERCRPGLPPSVAVAFADAVYNIGPRVACDTSASTAARLLAAKRYREACEQLPKWDKARVGGVMVSLPGLTKRRAAEMRVCLEGLQ
jgi:GH24 family phage-related lysozyme (muramidase)